MFLFSLLHELSMFIKHIGPTFVLIFNIAQETNVQKHSKVLHAHTLTTLKVYKRRVAGQTYTALYSSVLLYCEPVVKKSWQVAHLQQ